MTDVSELHEEQGPSHGFKQVLALVLLAGAIVILWAVYVIQHELASQREAMKWSVTEFGLNSRTHNRLSKDYEDQNRDLIADLPTDESEWVRPEKLAFCYIPGSDVDQEIAVWQPLMDAIAKATRIEVEYRRLNSVAHQIMELRTHTLHITALNTGSVPRAVNISGFVPVCTPGNKEGQFGVTMQMLVPRGSAVREIEDLRNRRIMFTSANSNSGFKAPIVILNEDFGMQPEIDYDYGFSSSHLESIRMVQSDTVGAAPVASDMLQRAESDGLIAASDYRIIYESERFPAAAFGYLYCLHPDIADKIRETLVDFDLVNTQLGQTLNADKLAPINYKDDWALIRRIDNALGVVHDPDINVGSDVANPRSAGGDPQGEAAETDSATRRDLDEASSGDSEKMKSVPEPNSASPSR
jgi:phosphonate transport system substrate-binding protein